MEPSPVLVAIREDLARLEAAAALASPLDDEAMADLYPLLAATQDALGALAEALERSSAAEGGLAQPARGRLAARWLRETALGSRVLTCCGFQNVLESCEVARKLAADSTDHERLREPEEPTWLTLDDDIDLRSALHRMEVLPHLEGNRTGDDLQGKLFAWLVGSDLHHSLHSLTQELAHFPDPRPGRHQAR
jgi:hypothetical protein